MKKLFLLFIDGIGLAEKSPANPVSRLFEKESDGFGMQMVSEPKFFDRSLLCPLDATLNIKGVPQSATGQTTIFTGINAAEHLGYHLPAFPNSELVEVILEKSIMKALKNEGIPVTSANMYSEKFFKDRRNAIKNRFPVSTLTIEAAESQFRMMKEYNEGKAVFADITNELIRKRGYDIEEISPHDAGKRIKPILQEFDFVFFEYFMTDHYGHKRKKPELENCITILNDFVTSLVEDMDLENEAVLIVSDHGNAEDFSTGGHTKNPVPGFLISRDKTVRDLFSRCRSLTDLYQFMLNYYKV
jgi:phosphopentomutase